MIPMKTVMCACHDVSAERELFWNMNIIKRRVKGTRQDVRERDMMPQVKWNENSLSSVFSSKCCRFYVRINTFNPLEFRFYHFGSLISPQVVLIKYTHSTQIFGYFQVDTSQKTNIPVVSSHQPSMFFMCGILAPKYFIVYFTTINAKCWVNYLTSKCFSVI